jgi:hypothetical protein
MSVNIKFFYSLIIFSALMLLSGYILFSTLLKDYFLPVFYLFIFYFMLLTLSGRLFLINSNPDKPGDFNTRYFLVRWMKVLLHLIFIVVYLLTTGKTFRRSFLPSLPAIFYSLYSISTHLVFI